MAKIAVTEVGWDDIGQILKKIDIKYTAVSCDLFHDPESLMEYDTVFVNCSSGASGFDWKSASDSTKAFLAKGGTIYASDLASSLVSQVFPSMMTFGSNSDQGERVAQVADTGLREMLGNRLTLHYDSVVTSVPKVTELVRVYVKCDGDNFVSSFRWKEGEVVYTTFHNHLQSSEEEQKLLQFLVLRPVLANAAQRSVARLESASLKSLTQVYSTTKLVTDKRLKYEVVSTEPLVFFLNWEGRAAFQISIYRPDGSLFDSKQGVDPPVILRVERPETGVWAYTVRTLDGRSKPYVLDVASDIGSGRGQPANRNRDRFCRYCGAGVPATATFCRYCGRELPALTGRS